MRTQMVLCLGLPFRPDEQRSVTQECLLHDNSVTHMETRIFRRNIRRRSSLSLVRTQTSYRPRTPLQQTTHGRLIHMNQHTQELLQPKAYMLQTSQEGIPPHARILLTEVDILQPLPSLSSTRRKSRWREWWTEERLAMLTLIVGNMFFFLLALWWFS